MVRGGLTPDGIDQGRHHQRRRGDADGRTSWALLKPVSWPTPSSSTATPLSDIFCLTHADHVKLVIKDGKIEKNTL